MRPSSNQTFSFPRFARLFGRHTAEHLPAYLLTAAVGLGLMFVVMGFLTYLQKSAPSVMAQGIFFMLFVLGGGVVFASTVFAQFGERRRASVALLLPASHFEKWLVAWLYSLPIFLLAFTPLFYLADAAVVYAGVGPGQTPEVVNIFAASARQEIGGVLWFLTLLNGVGLWGAIYFEKAHFIKTAFAVLLLMGVLSTLNHQVLKLIVGKADMRVAPPFTAVVFSEGQQFFRIGLPDDQMNWLAWVPLLLAGLLWLASYFRVTEKQL
ncbi:hypothetical protein Q5H92_11300 [Hymenobacter sp. M29]|uniref:ABC transporter permease n=1 Tax=Hymenobacter mellowenesis TaxID=3063995 RepID=A0ABT9AAT2_9BACT|nr:hypothetical protein [Hymenobacter sp. M29]MDO7846946.1 hypothetical protein [Hymenobacter sp. M29]